MAPRSTPFPAVGLCAGAALYLVAHIAFQAHALFAPALVVATSVIRSVRSVTTRISRSLDAPLESGSRVDVIAAISGG